MPSARFPFLKDPKPAAAPLDIVEHARHNVYSPLGPFCPLAPKRLMLSNPKRPLDIKFPWITETAQSGADAARAAVTCAISEWKEAHPDDGHPTNTDLIVWYRQRAIDAEMHSGGLDSEVNRLEGVNERLEKEIGQMTIDMRIRSASHGV